jgi:hypothetical protein
MRGTQLKQTSYRALSTANTGCRAGATELARADAPEEQVPLHLLLRVDVSTPKAELAGIIPGRHENNGKPRNTN